MNYSTASQMPAPPVERKTLRGAFERLEGIKSEISSLLNLASEFSGPFPEDGSDAKVRPVAAGTVEELHEQLGQIHNRLQFARQRLETAHG